jgi:hypothetical protein
MLGHFALPVDKSCQILTKTLVLRKAALVFDPCHPPQMFRRVAWRAFPNRPGERAIPYLRATLMSGLWR